MGKKRSWLTFVKKLFISEAKSNTEKKSKRWRWMFGRFRFRQHPEIAAEQKTLSEAAEEQRKHVLAAAIATAAAAKAAVAAANAAAEVVWLTQNLESKVETRLLSEFKAFTVDTLRGYDHGIDCIEKHYTITYRNMRIFGAEFRCYQFRPKSKEARKALNAMKGLVKLQAVIRGEIARRRMIAKLKFIQSLAMTRSQVFKLRVATADEHHYASEKRQIFMPKEIMNFQDIELECNKHRNWELSLVPKEELDTLWLRKQEATIRRDRLKKYSFSHRERRNDQILQVAVNNGKSERQISQIDQLAEVETQRNQATDKFKSFVHPKFIAEDANHVVRFKLRNTYDQDSTGGLDSPVSRPRRSFGDIKQKSIGDDSSLPNSPIFPSYMAATQSAMAKARSFSTPKQRLTLSDSCSSQHSPYKLRLSSSSSFNGETTSIEKKSGISQQRYANTGGLYRE